VDIQFGDGPILTLDLDGSIQPREEAGIGPEMAAIASSLNVYEASPSGDDEHVERLFETVPAGVRERGISYPSETVPQVLGSDSLRLAQSGHNRKGSRTFRKRTQKRSGLDQPSQKQRVRGVVQRKKQKRQKSQKCTEHISDQKDLPQYHIEQQSLFEGLDQPDRQSDLSKGAGGSSTGPCSKKTEAAATRPPQTDGGQTHDTPPSGVEESEPMVTSSEAEEAGVIRETASNLFSEQRKREYGH
jgi:hypothetical protein